MRINPVTAAAAAFCLLIISCGQENSETPLSRLSGQLTNSGGEVIYLEQMTAQGTKTIDTATVNETGAFAFYRGIPEKGFYRIRISERNFATLVLDSTETVTITGSAADLGNTFAVEGSEDSKLLWQFTLDSRSSYRTRDSLQRAFEMFINSMPGKMDSVRMDSMSRVIEGPFDTLVNRHNRYITAFIDRNLTSFVSLAAVQELNPEEYFPYYIKIDEAMMKKYPSSPYVILFHQNVEALKSKPQQQP